MITIGLGFLVPWPMTMCIMSLRSASHISMQSKSIQSIGVRTNTLLMKAYVVFWFDHAVLNTTLFVIWLFLQNYDFEDELTKSRLRVAMAYFFLACLINAISLDHLIIYFYYKHSLRLS